MDWLTEPWSWGDKFWAAWWAFFAWRVWASVSRDLAHHRGEGGRQAGSPGSGDREQFLYAIRNPVTGLVKLGISDEPRRRLRELECAGGIRLQLLGVWRGGYSLEQRLHADLAEHRAEGEWFRPHEAVLAELATLEGQVEEVAG